MGPTFFPCYLATVVALACILDRFFLKRKDVQACFGGVFDRLQNLGNGKGSQEKGLYGLVNEPSNAIISFDDSVANLDDDLDIPTANWAVGLPMRISCRLSSIFCCNPLRFHTIIPLF